MSLTFFKLNIGKGRRGILNRNPVINGKFDAMAEIEQDRCLV